MWGAKACLSISTVCDSHAWTAADRLTKKSRAHKARRSQTGRLHVWETWDPKIPSFERDRPKPLVSKTWSQTTPVGRECERRCFGYWHAACACLAAHMQYAGLCRLKARLGHLAQKEIAKHRDSLRMAQFLGIGEVDVGGPDIELRQQHLELGRLAGEVVGQRSYPQTGLHRAKNPVGIVDPQHDEPRVLVGVALAQQPVHVLHRRARILAED